VPVQLLYPDAHTRILEEEKKKKVKKIIAAERGYVVHAGILQEALFFFVRPPGLLVLRPGVTYHGF